MRLKIPNGHAAAAFGQWTLYALPARKDDSFLWLKFKIMLPPDAPAKWGQRRAYRLAWNAADLRFARDSAIVDLQRAQPDLFAQVELYMSLNHGPESLPVSSGEIAAEKQRLALARRQWKKGRS